MAAESWEARLEQIDEIVQAALQNRPAPAGLSRQEAANQAVWARRALA
jgi:hypothetical protein